MSWETAKKYIDLIFEDAKELHLLEIEEYNALEHRKIFEFIGGEPLIESELVFKCMDYILEKWRALPDPHPWKYMLWECPNCKAAHGNIPGIRFHIQSNGIALSDPKIREKLLTYDANFISLAVTVDGPKHIHDMCRVDKNGNPSYDRVMESWSFLKQNFPVTVFSTKSTIAHENLELIPEIIKYCYEFGFKEVYQNCVFENVWVEGDHFVLFDKLCETADYLIDGEKYKEIYVRWFDYHIFQKSSFEGKWCGAGKYMDACDFSGTVYPCLRFKHTDNPERAAITVGSLDNWPSKKYREEVYKKMEHDHEKIKSVLGLDCKSCPASMLCSDCCALSYNETGESGLRTPWICPMHKAVVIANVYFFSKILNIPCDKNELLLLLDVWTSNNKFKMRFEDYASHS
jgi:radical SAM protein with 4Fe4S-binding SPASM domain